MGDRVQFRIEIDGKFAVHEGELVRKDNGETWMIPDKAFENPRLGESHLLDPALLEELPNSAAGKPHYRYRGVLGPDAPQKRVVIRKTPQ